jgi:hypothetical protein
MRDEAAIREALAKAHDEKRLVSCRVPNGGGIAMALEQHIVEDAINSWRSSGDDESARKALLSSISRSIERVVERVKQGKATDGEMDDLAADVALWLGHELLYADGERHLVKGPSRENLRNPKVG